MKFLLKNRVPGFFPLLLFCAIYLQANYPGSGQKINPLKGKSEISLTTGTAGSKAINGFPFRSLLSIEGQVANTIGSFDSQQSFDHAKARFGYFSNRLQVLALNYESITQLIIPALNVLVIIFPFHSFL